MELNFTAGMPPKVKPDPVELHTNVARVWSSYQNDIFDFVQNDYRSAIVRAVAGSGKTTTIVEAFKRVPITHSAVFLAFNTSIVEELAMRGVNAKTFNSIGHIAMAKTGKIFTPDRGVKGKLWQILQANLRPEIIAVCGQPVVQLVSLARNAALGIGREATRVDFRELAESYCLDFEDANPEDVINYAFYLLKASRSSELFDFEDQLYMPVALGLTLPKYDVIFVDECQDTNAIQRYMLHAMRHPHTRIIAVGDPAQAIYGFRGADPQATQRLTEEFQCQELSLSISYRCAKRIVEEAQQYAAHIQASPTAPDGLVEHHGTNWGHTMFPAGSMILSRANRPLMKTALYLLRNGIPVRMASGDLAATLQKLINQSACQNVDGLISWIHKWAVKEMNKSSTSDDRKEYLADMRDTVLALCESCETIAAIEQTLSQMSSRNPSAVICSSIHKAKGLEADIVFYLQPKRQSRRPLNEWQQEQEDNLRYVAITRAKTELHYITERNH